MDSFFGIGLPELVLILILAGLVMGPQRIRQVARLLGRFVAQVQGLSRQFTRQLNSELDALDSDDVRGAMDEMKELRRQLIDLRSQLSSIPADMTKEGQKAVQEGKAVLNEEESKPPAGSQVSSNGKSAAPAETTSLPRPVEIPDDPE
jgi:Sec-independent protein translocase protein TatA